MRRRLLAFAWATGLVALATVGLTAVPAAADAPTGQGWWTVTNPLPAPPDVPADGLLVQGGLGGSPVAFAALVYQFNQGTTVHTLTLTVAPNSVTTPAATLDLCRLIQPIVHADQGGPMSEAPAYDCARKVTAAPASNGTDYQFDVSGLVSDNLVAVAVLPDAPVSRVVLSAPDSNSLATQAAPGATPPAAGNSASTAPSNAATGALPQPAFQGAASPSQAGSVPGTAATGPSSVAVAPVVASPGRSTPAAGFLTTVASGPEKAVPLLVLLLVVGSLGGAALWLNAGRQRDGAALSAP